jgi:hypothetical protein
MGMDITARFGRQRFGWLVVSWKNGPPLNGWLPGFSCMTGCLSPLPLRTSLLVLTIAGSKQTSGLVAPRVSAGSCRQLRRARLSPSTLRAARLLFFAHPPGPICLCKTRAAATECLETEYGTNFETKAEVGPVKILSISDFVTATGTVQRSAGRGAKSPTYRIPHREGLKQMFGDSAVDALLRRAGSSVLGGLGGSRW